MGRLGLAVGRAHGKSGTAQDVAPVKCGFHSVLQGCAAIHPSNSSGIRYTCLARDVVE